MKNFTDIEALAWMYKQLSNTIASFPTSLCDFVKLPRDYPETEDGIYDIDYMAEREANRILANIQ